MDDNDVIDEMICVCHSECITEISACSAQNSIVDDN